jgi:oligopeptide/dipeptide ABC transporter ATP-binding protein
MFKFGQDAIKVQQGILASNGPDATTLSWDPIDASLADQVTGAKAAQFVSGPSSCKIVEKGAKAQIYGEPQHPYTQALLSAAPDINIVRGVPPKERIRLIGDPPSAIDPPSGCRSRTRCWKAEDVYGRQEPALELKLTTGPSEGHTIACHFPEIKDTLVAEILA